jgi:ABC-type antimicrobial peptide transport system permease subunit
MQLVRTIHFGVIAFSVMQRTREFGIRMALGARAPKVVGMVAWDGLKIAAGGCAGGICAALWLTRYLRTLLFGVGALDPGTFVGAVLLLVCVALIACALPAGRAARIDPVRALRQE